MNSHEKGILYIFTVAVVVLAIFVCSGIYIHHAQTMKYIESGYTQRFDPISHNMIWTKE